MSLRNALGLCLEAERILRLFKGVVWPQATKKGRAGRREASSSLDTPGPVLSPGRAQTWPGSGLLEVYVPSE